MPYRLVVMGSYNVGKSALIVQLVRNCFVTDHNLSIEDCYTHMVVDDEPCQLQILDTIGNNENQDQLLESMRWGKGFLCVYAVDDIQSFVDVNVFRDQLFGIKNTDRVPLVLVANKTDLANCLVPPLLGQEAAKNFGVPFVETSAKTGQGVKHAFRELVREMRRLRAPQPEHLPVAEQKRSCGLEYCTIQ